MVTLLLLVVFAILVGLELSGLRRRVELAEVQSAGAAELGERVDALARRIAALETLVSLRASPQEPRAETRPPVEALERRPASERPASAPVARPQPSAHADVPRAVERDSARPASTQDSPEPEEPVVPEAWEVVVGTSWLNKLGVLIFVTGIALLLGYSMAHVGPLGRVAIGAAVSATMLGIGATLERVAAYRAFGLGLVAGGWAGLYVTAFAMHALPAARIIESDVVALLALMAVAAGMVVHSLKYRAEAVTSLAYAAAYLPLVLTPLSTFSLVAALPLAVSLLFVASRLGWTSLSLFGLVSTYGLLVLRGRVLPGDPLEGASVTSYLLIGAYWLLFELADLVSMRFDRRSGRPHAPLFAANAVGYLGAFLSLMGPTPDGHAMSLLAVTALAYLASAYARSRVTAGDVAAAGDSRRFTTIHGALALSAALTAWAIDLRLAGPRETMTLLIEAELLLAAALTMADRHVRQIAAAAAGVVTVHAAATLAGQGDALSWPWAMPGWVPSVSLVAATWYGNREWLRRRGEDITRAEQIFPWVGLVFAALVVRELLSSEFQGVAGLVAAVLLTELGRRNRGEYLWQARAAFGAAIPAVLLAAGSLPPRSAEVWQTLPAAALLCFVGAWRQRDSIPHPAGTVTAAAVACAGTVFVVLLEALAISNIWILPAWTLTALGAVAVGVGFRLAIFRWQGYALAVMAALPAAAGLAFDQTWSLEAQMALFSVIAGLFATGYVGRRAATHAGERVAAGLVALAGTATLTIFKWRVLPASAVAPAWAAESLVLVSLGRLRDRAGQRWQGYAAAGLALGHTALWATAEMKQALVAGTSPSWLVPTAATVVALAAFIATYLGRTRGPRAVQTSLAARLEDVTLACLPAGATLTLATVEAVWFNPPGLTLALALTGAALLTAGIVARAIDIRGNGYALQAFAAATTWTVLGTHPAGLSLAWPGAASAVLFVSGLVTRGPIGKASALVSSQGQRTESAVRLTLALIAACLAMVFIATEAPPAFVTMGWGLEGIVLLFTGFVARERALRLAGLTLLFLCILKLFLYDLRELESLARILSFVALGIVLLGVSWTYTKFKEDIRRLL